MIFSIIIPHYDKAISDERFIACLDSLLNQSFKDFEVLLYHDGSLNRPLSEEVATRIIKLGTKMRIVPFKGVWGHNLRDLGIKEARGEYIIHLNSDNVLFDLRDLIIAISESGFMPVYIFRLIMVGVITINHKTTLFRTMNPADKLILNGVPKPNHIDCMQLVAKREVWLSRGGWNDLSKNSDGLIYEDICKKYPYHNSKIVIGEHW